MIETFEDSDELMTSSRMIFQKKRSLETSRQSKGRVVAGVAAGVTARVGAKTLPFIFP
jgi:hypothetical protein